MVVLISMSSLYIYIDLRLKKVALNFAMSEAKTTILDCANKAALTVLESMNLNYYDIAVLNRNTEGLVTSVEINSKEINMFKSQIAAKVSEELSKHRNVTFQLPLFAAFGYFYNAFYIPKFTYKVELTTTAITNFESKFYSAGINQVLHQILVNINLESSLAIPHCATDLSTKTSLIAAETVIVGVVPEAFTEVIDAEEELVGEIFDYSAGINNGGINGF